MQVNMIKSFSFFCLIVVSFVMNNVCVFFFTTYGERAFFRRSNLHALASSVFWFRGIDGLGENESRRFRSPKCVEEGALLVQSKRKSA